MFDENSGVKQVQLLLPAAVTASGNGTGVDLKDYIGLAKVILHSAKASAGTSPTMDVKIQDSADDSSYADVSGAAFTQVTDVADSLQGISLDLDKCRRYVRAVKTIGGTDSPSFVLGCVLIGKKQVST